MANIPFSFGQMNSTPFQANPNGTPLGTIAKGGVSGLSSLFGSLNGNQSTVPFAGGGTAEPSPVGVLAKSMGNNAKNPYGNISTQGNTITPQMTQPTPPQTQGGTSISSGTVGGNNPVVSPNLNAINAPNMSNGQFINDSGTGTGNAQPLGGFGSNVGALSTLAGTSSPQYQAAQQQYFDANKQLADLKAQDAQQSADITGMGTNLQRAGGLQGLLQNLFASKQSALTGEMTAAQTAAQTATGQQSAQQTGLASAATVTQPTQVPYSNQYLYPLTRQSVGGGSGGSYSIQSAAQQYAQKVQNGEMSYSDAVSALSGYGVAGQQALNSALPPGFNVNQSNATAGSQSAQTQQVQQYESASQQAKNLSLQLNQVISSTGINPNDLNVANKAIQAIASNTSNPNYQTFSNLINDLANTYAQVLTPAGGTTTDMVRSISKNLLNSSMSGSGISQVVQNLDSQVQAKIAGVTTAYGTNTNTSGTSGNQPAGWF